MVVQWTIDKYNFKGQTYYNNAFDFNTSLWDIQRNKVPNISIYKAQRVYKNLTGMYSGDTRREVVLEKTPNSSDKNVIIFEHSGNSYPDVFSDGPYSLFKNVPDPIFEWLRNFPFVSIVIVESHEAKLTAEHLDLVISYIAQYRDKYRFKNRVIIQNCGYNTGDTLSKTLPPGIEVANGLSYLQHTVAYTVTKEECVELSNKFKDVPLFDTKVLNYNGRWRAPRALLHNEVIKSIDPKYLKYSFQGLVCDWQKELKVESLVNDSIRPFTSITDKNNPELIKKIKQGKSGNTYRFNEPGMDYNANGSPQYRHLPNLEDYEKTFCEVIAETIIIREGMGEERKKLVFMTEKTLKPILARRPFIIASNGGHLNALKELGFKTFDQWFDESYDNPDLTLGDSLKIINKNLNYINSKTVEELVDIYKQMQPIFEHNVKRMLDFIYSDKPQVLLNLEKMFK